MFRLGRGRRKAAVIAAAVATVAWGAAMVAQPAHGASVTPSAITATQKWTVTENDAGGPISESSPVVANLPGGPAAVVGDRSGNLFAHYLSNGAVPAGWPVKLGAPIDAPPSSLNGIVYVGTGDAAAPTPGAYYAINGNGSIKWRVTVPNVPGGSVAGGIGSGMAIGTLQGTTSTIGGGLIQQEDEIDAASGTVKPGFPWLQADTDYSTPALADLYNTGQNEIIEGGASTSSNGQQSGAETYINGGHIRILPQTGNQGAQYANGGLICDNQVDQTVDASPAVGRFLTGGKIGIVTGTGLEYTGARAYSDAVVATDTHCNQVWKTTLDGYTQSSPALVDALGNGGLQVAEATTNSSVYLLNAATGGVIWRSSTLAESLGSVATADFGEGYQDILVPTIEGLQIFDGKTGALVATLGKYTGLQSTPLVTDDPDGNIGITIAGYNGANTGVITHFEVSGTDGSKVNETGAWPEFHHDPQLTGNAGIAPPVVEVPCTAPGNPNGYEMPASTGDEVQFGNLPNCGSTAQLTLTKPIVGGATTKDGGGYWQVASDGGLFSFGDAGFYGSAGNLQLTKPVVGMAVTPDGKGYWLVASDGGIFNYGDAGFYGSAGNLKLTKPVVAMAADSQTGGYWLVGADGGIFAYNAPFLGGEGGTQLVKPIVAMMSANGGAGYRMVASDGGVFSYNVAFDGSAASDGLNIVGVSGVGT